MTIDPGAGAGRDATHGAAIEPDALSTDGASDGLREGLDVPDPDLAEEYAESAGIDPAPDQVDAYLELEGEAPLGEERPLEEPVEQARRHDRES
ncbi:MAG TPA: hypothetical protein VFS29_01520 [Motilibacteraceae bacterium]|nr:hypothetical protein [Motilibacteraceae bacterium]